jgi:hypothetical protein
MVETRGLEPLTPALQRRCACEVFNRVFAGQEHNWALVSELVR